MKVLTVDEPTPCFQKFELFNSTHLIDHHNARALCQTCPVRRACRDLAPGPLEGFEGTWAGLAYGIRVKRRRDQDDAA